METKIQANNQILPGYALLRTAQELTAAGFFVPIY